MQGLNDLDPQTRERFRAIQRQFLAGLPQRWALITNADSPTACHGELHRLAGAAGGYGFDRIGDLARQAMLHLNRCASEQLPVRVPGGEWDQLLCELGRSIEEAQSAPPGP